MLLAANIGVQLQGNASKMLNSTFIGNISAGKLTGWAYSMQCCIIQSIGVNYEILNSTQVNPCNASLSG
jgi:hypothetical protein